MLSLTRQVLMIVSFLTILSLATFADEHVISTSNANQYQPDVAFNPGAKQFLVAWTDDSSGFEDIYGRLVIDGSNEGVEFAICTCHGDQSEVALAGGNDQWLAIFAEYDPGNGSIVGRRVSNTGSIIGGRIIVATATTYTTRYPDVAYSTAEDKYLVVWTDRRDDTTGFDVYGRLVGGDGSLGTEIAISTADFNQLYPKVAFNESDGEFLVVWKDSTAADDIYGRRIDDDGTLLGGAFSIVNNASANPSFPALAYNDFGGEYLVVWQDARNSTLDIYGQRVSNVGGLLGGSIRISTSTTRDERDPDVTFNGLGRYFKAVWKQEEPSGSLWDIHAAEVDPAGVVRNNIVLCNVSDTQEDPAIAYGVSDVSDQVLAVWSDMRNSGSSGSDVYADTAAGPSIRVCGTGGVNAASGTPADVLTINSSTGGIDRAVQIGTNEAFDISMNVSPAGPDPGKFALYAWLGEPDETTITPHPQNLGNMCFPTPLSRGTPRPKKIWNNIGKTPLLGEADFPSDPAPSIVFESSGLGQSRTVTFQGFILDAGSTADKPGSITNAVILRISSKQE